MKEIIDKLPPCPNGAPTRCVFEIENAIKTSEPFHPQWNREGQLIKANPNRTVGIVACERCGFRWEYRYDHTKPGGFSKAKVKAITENPKEIPKELHSRKQIHDEWKAKLKAARAAATRANKANAKKR